MTNCVPLRVLFLSLLAQFGGGFTGGAIGEDPVRTKGDTADLDSADWSGIREAYEAGRHAAFVVDSGYQARNPGQLWRTRFDGRGFTVRPDAGGWEWGLELERWGFAGEEHAVRDPHQTKADGGRVTYEWNELLEEWYVNDARGLEHGSTVRERPERRSSSAAGALTLTLAVRGALRPEVTADGRACASSTTVAHRCSTTRG